MAIDVALKQEKVDEPADIQACPVRYFGRCYRWRHRGGDTARHLQAGRQPGRLKGRGYLLQGLELLHSGPLLASSSIGRGPSAEAPRPLALGAYFSP